MTEQAGHLQRAIHSASEHLLSLQQPDGYWMGELRADESVTAGYITLMCTLFDQIHPERLQKAIKTVLSRQNLDGSWSLFYEGPGNLDVSIQCYLGLKAGGLSADDPDMRRAGAFIRSQGGLTHANTVTKIWLCVFGEYDYHGIPSAPPELMLLPENGFFSIYDFASWSRETLVALMVLLTNQPVFPLPAGRGVEELFIEPPGPQRRPLAKIGNPFSWRGFFQLADRLFKLWGKLPNPPGRKKALKKAEDWLVEHQESDGSWGGILLPWLYAIFALRSQGYEMDHPVLVRAIAGFEGFLYEEQDSLCFLPATSPVWDTAWSVVALREAGLSSTDPRLIKAAEWLLSKEIHRRGDWHVKNPHLEGGGWSFEFVNEWYPDLDDTALAPRALLRVDLAGETAARRALAVQRARAWALGMQSKDGGWGAFDRDNNSLFLEHVPFSDFLTPLDPTCADVTAHALELLAEVEQDPAVVQKGVAYLKRTQQTDGSWYGRWGVCHLYGTGLALGGLEAAGEDMRQPYIRRAVAWLEAHQNPDGGWGETPQVYSDTQLRGQGESSASQTAWALSGLLAAREHRSPSAQRAVDYLLRTQSADGGWGEPYFTGTGFPRVFYLRYDLYRLYFPLLTLSHYQRLILADNKK